MAEGYADETFYEKYERYATDPRVRAVHDPILKAAASHPALQRVLDLGCGKYMEYARHARPAFYIGMDVNADPVAEPGRGAVTGDYRDIGQVIDLIRRNGITGVVSLFSAEITAPRAVNHAYYEELFRATDIKAMFVTSFYYKHALGQEIAYEKLDNIELQSYQTFQPILRPPTMLFDELRILTANPSLFGNDVVDVSTLLQKPGENDMNATRALARLVEPHLLSFRMAEGLPPAPSSRLVARSLARGM